VQLGTELKRTELDDLYESACGFVGDVWEYAGTDAGGLWMVASGLPGGVGLVCTGVRANVVDRVKVAREDLEMYPTNPSRIVPECHFLR
jgi:hypothetical protein